MFKGGVEGIHQVIASGGLSELAGFKRWARPGLKPRPATAEQLDRLRLPGDRPLPATWRAWLAFDTAWLTEWGWFDPSAEGLVFTPRPLKALVTEEYGAMWGQFYDVPRMRHCFLLPGGSDSRRVLVLTDHPDAEGEHPVLFTDVDDMPALGAYYAGLDIFLGWAAGLLAGPTGSWVTYTDHAKLPDQRARNAHHVKHLLGGQWEVSFPGDALK